MSINCICTCDGSQNEHMSLPVFVAFNDQGAELVAWNENCTCCNMYLLNYRVLGEGSAWPSWQLYSMCHVCCIIVSMCSNRCYDIVTDNWILPTAGSYCVNLVMIQGKIQHGLRVSNAITSLRIALIFKYDIWQICNCTEPEFINTRFGLFDHH